MTAEKLREIPPFEFENCAVIAWHIPNKVQVGDMGVDGRIFPVFDTIFPPRHPRRLLRRQPGTARQAGAFMVMDTA
ncbi:MAG TPA: hypothetical protein VMV89_06125 [Candidatus Paceibacterota bacterium]|nr:hypothetical protein [Candidatus Paceibacterota bacterium]